MTRSEAREQAFTLLFEHTFKPEEPLERLVETAAEGRDLVVDPYAERLFERTTQLWDELGEIIRRYLKGWRMERISRVSLVLLRMALCEMRCEETVPVSVAINEAVELAKKYSVPDDARFVNGVLGSAARADGAPNDSLVPAADAKPETDGDNAQ